jgi:DNA (cytosine-5)-methyltransferase 1
VLRHHYPEVPNLGDMTALPNRIRSGEVEAPDLFCGGTPCQAFSVAGLRRSLDDARGNLSLTFCEITDAIDAVRLARGKPASIVFWENVPGVLSTADNAFGCFLAGLAGEDDPLVPPGGKWTDAGVVYGPQRTVAWRILDAQYFGLAQRRKRVFVVASARDGFDPSKVLFEYEGLRRDSAPSREAGQGASRGASAGAGSGIDFQNAALSGDLAGTLDAEGQRRGNRGHGVLAHAFDARQSDVIQYGDKTGPLDTNGHTVGVMQPVAFQPRIARNGRGNMGDVVNALQAQSGQTGKGDAAPCVATAMQVRRLTPVECERLQGFPDGYTAIPWRGKLASECPDGPRYKALGNSWAVPVVRWIGRRINERIGNA